MRHFGCAINNKTAIANYSPFENLLIEVMFLTKPCVFESVYRFNAYLRYLITLFGTELTRFNVIFYLNFCVVTFYLRWF